MQRIVKRIKSALYFPVAYYFRFWAGFRLRRWRPIIIVITGSNGKTFLLSLFSHLLGNKACFTFGANSAFGIPFYLLNLRRKNYSVFEWLLFFFKAPFSAWEKIPEQKLLFVEADCDRTGEGKFLASFLHPAITLWQNVSLTHSENFTAKNNKSVLGAIAFEFGYFLEYTAELAVINADQPEIVKQCCRSKSAIQQISKKSLTSYQVSLSGTDFVIDRQKYHFGFLLPRASFLAIAMTKIACDYLHIPFNPKFTDLTLAPGRSTLLAGIKNTTIIDSSYNSNFSSMEAVLSMIQKIDHHDKWLIIGDMVELGDQEKAEHEKLAEMLLKMNFTKLILLGKRNQKFTLPRLLQDNNVAGKVAFLMPQDAVSYIKDRLAGKELLVFKGAGFLEKIIEELLLNKDDAGLLCRREEVWQKKRSKYYQS